MTTIGILMTIIGALLISAVIIGAIGYLLILAEGMKR